MQEAGSVVRVRMTVAYDGRDFSGFAPQPNAVTVGGALAGALQRALQLDAPPDLGIAGRTDAGVHGWGQVVSFDAPAEGLDLERLQRSVNSQLSPRVVAREVVRAPAGFHARHSALRRRYRYTVLNRPVPDPFLAATSWHVADPLDLAALRLACDPLLGEHDFTSFCRAPRGVENYSLVRRVTEAAWTDTGDGVLRFEIEATSFCQQMVRAVVGTMVLMGTGRRRAGEMRSILVQRERAAAGRVAPAHGLCLWAVTYPAHTDGCP
ncbi:MAG: tRNA pseudouridine(38-40) synthase TruA [Acidimicrobiia bacterium]